jgi:hypothetical protein
MIFPIWRTGFRLQTVPHVLDGIISQLVAAPHTVSETLRQ